MYMHCVYVCVCVRACEKYIIPVKQNHELQMADRVTEARDVARIGFSRVRSRPGESIEMPGAKETASH